MILPSHVSVADLAGLPGLPSKRTLKRIAGRGEIKTELVKAQGGEQYRFVVSELPREWQIALAKNLLRADSVEGVEARCDASHTQTCTTPRGSGTARQDKGRNSLRKKTGTDVEQLEAVWAKKTERQKKKGQRRAKALFAVEKLQADGLTKSDAVKAVAQQQKVCVGHRHAQKRAVRSGAGG